MRRGAELNDVGTEKIGRPSDSGRGATEELPERPNQPLGVFQGSGNEEIDVDGQTRVSVRDDGPPAHDEKTDTMLVEDPDEIPMIRA